MDVDANWALQKIYNCEVENCPVTVQNGLDLWDQEVLSFSVFVPQAAWILRSQTPTCVSVHCSSVWHFGPEQQDRNTQVTFNKSQRKHASNSYCFSNSSVLLFLSVSWTSCRCHHQVAAEPQQISFILQPCSLWWLLTVWWVCLLNM